MSSTQSLCCLDCKQSIWAGQSHAREGSNYIYSAVIVADFLFAHRGHALTYRTDGVPDGPEDIFDDVESTLRAERTRLEGNTEWDEQEKPLPPDLQAAIDAREEAISLVHNLKLQAQIHAQEARTANATIAEIYQTVTGKTGEPGNWNGAEPVRRMVDQLKAKAALHDAVQRVAGELPFGWCVEISVENGGGGVLLSDPDCKTVEFATNYESLADEVIDALSAALDQQGKGGET